jgi:hypothetical protein
LYSLPNISKIIYNEEDDVGGAYYLKGGGEECIWATGRKAIGKETTRKTKI